MTPLVIIHELPWVSLVEQDTIEYVSWPIQNSLLFFKIKKWFFYLHFMQPFSADATIFKKEIFVHENIKKNALKVAHNRPKTSPNLNLCSIKIAHHATHFGQ